MIMALINKSPALPLLLKIDKSENPYYRHKITNKGDHRLTHQEVVNHPKT